MASLAMLWNILRTWDALEPVEHHTPIRLAILNALVSSIALIICMACCTLISLWRQDVSLPDDDWDHDVLYIRVGQPKTRFRAARNQHVRVDQPLVERLDKRDSQPRSTLAAHLAGLLGGLHSSPGPSPDFCFGETRFLAFIFASWWCYLPFQTWVWKFASPSVARALALISHA